MVGALERVAAQGEQLGQAQLDERLLPDLEAMGALLQEVQLPLVVAQGREPAAVGPVEELLARRLGGLALEERQQVVAVEVDREGSIGTAGGGKSAAIAYTGSSKS